MADSTKNPVIIWFRRDLRIDDHPALSEACARGAPVLPVYIHDDDASPGLHFRTGAASGVWLAHSLRALNDSLSGALRLYRGDAREILPRLARETGAQAVFWSRRYEPWRKPYDTQVKSALRADGIEAQSFKDSLLFEPWENMKADGTPYRVFTPFYKKCYLERADFFPPPRPAETLDLYGGGPSDGLCVDDLSLFPAPPAPRWDTGMIGRWDPGEAGAHARLSRVLGAVLPGYDDGRNYPAKDLTSRLSPHLHFGEISSRRLWESCARSPAFRRELVWREFCYHLLFHFPDLPDEPLQPKFSAFPWEENGAVFVRWCKGQTGYPIVDAGMRQLWASGWMHNRVRMIVGSFLVKDLLIPWQKGRAWFEDTLVDADPANNAAGWQWIAGCGADAAPFFRIFNPVTQGQKFDPDGDYVRRWVPELSGLPARYIHAPWKAPSPPRDYPPPMVDHAAARVRALNAFASIKG